MIGRFPAEVTRPAVSPPRIGAEQQALKALDGQVSHNATDRIALTFDAIDITDEKIEQFSGAELRPLAICDNGRQSYAGVRFKFWVGPSRTEFPGRRGWFRITAWIDPPPARSLPPR